MPARCQADALSKNWAGYPNSGQKALAIPAATVGKASAVPHIGHFRVTRHFEGVVTVSGNDPCDLYVLKG